MSCDSPWWLFWVHLLSTLTFLSFESVSFWGAGCGTIQSGMDLDADPSDFSQLSTISDLPKLVCFMLKSVPGVPWVVRLQTKVEKQVDIKNSKRGILQVLQGRKVRGLPQQITYEILNFSSVLGFGLISKHVQCTLCLFYKNIKNIWASAPYVVCS